MQDKKNFLPVVDDLIESKDPRCPMCIGVNNPLLAPRDLDDLLPLGPERTGELKEDLSGATERDGGDGGGLFED